MTTVDVTDTELGARHRTVWGKGDYPRMVETFLLPVGQALVAAADVQPGTRVLDVAAGRGRRDAPAMAAGSVLEGTRALQRADREEARREFASALQPTTRWRVTASVWRSGSSWRSPRGSPSASGPSRAWSAARRCDEAARVAVWVSHQHLLGGRASASRGWLARAELARDEARTALTGRTPGSPRRW